MTVRTHRQRPRTRQRLGRRAPERAPSAATDVAQPTAQAREREAGGPEDRAAYCCACGYVFLAPVSTTVGCPHCGSTQAW